MQEEEAEEEEEEEQLQQQELPYSGTKDSPKHAPPMPRLSQSGNLPDTQQSELTFPFWKAQGRAAFSASTCQKTFGHTAHKIFSEQRNRRRQMVFPHLDSFRPCPIAFSMLHYVDWIDTKQCRHQ